MKKLFVVAAGIYQNRGGSQTLSDTGKKQMDRLLDQLKPLIDKDTVEILSGPETWVRESARMLATGLGCISINVHQEELISSGRRNDCAAVHKLVKSAGENKGVVIVVVHIRYTGTYPEYFWQQELRLTGFPRKELKKGHAWFIDCVEKSHRVIKQP